MPGLSVLTVTPVLAIPGWYAECPDEIYDDVAPTAENTLALVTREPVGVVGTVVPWNFPMLMAAWKFAPAMAAGSPVILKPTEQSPRTAIRIAELAAEAGIPAGVHICVEWKPSLLRHVAAGSKQFRRATRGRRMRDLETQSAIFVVKARKCLVAIVNMCVGCDEKNSARSPMGEMCPAHRQLPEQPPPGRHAAWVRGTGRPAKWEVFGQY